MGKHGMTLNPGQEVEIDGAYPSEVGNKRYKPCCVSDIKRGIVDVTIITDLPVETPKAAAKKVAKAEKTDSSAESVDVTSGITDTDTRFGTGTAEDFLPPKVTLPGHNADFPSAPPQTKRVFETGTTITHEEAAELRVSEAPTTKLAEPATTVAPPAKEEKKPTTRRPRTRKAAVDAEGNKAPTKLAPAKNAPAKKE